MKNLGMKMGCVSYLVKIKREEKKSFTMYSRITNLCAKDSKENANETL